MAINDETFTAIVLRTPRDVPIPGREWTYYRHAEHGGLVDDPLYADRATNIDGHLWSMEDFARRSWPNREWERCRLIVDVKPFSSKVSAAMDENIKQIVRREAVKRLTDNEKRALGLEVS